ncbi:unnamed protein product, partial [Staurois parvus]
MVRVTSQGSEQERSAAVLRFRQGQQLEQKQDAGTDTGPGQKQNQGRLNLA